MTSKILFSNTLLLLITCVHVPASADLVLSNGNFEAELRGSDGSIVNRTDGEVIGGSNWAVFGQPFARTGIGGNLTNSLSYVNTMDAGIGVAPLWRSAYQFIDATSAAGTFELSFDRFLSNNGSAVASTGLSQSIAIFGLSSDWDGAGLLNPGFRFTSDQSVFPAPNLSSGQANLLAEFSVNDPALSWSSEAFTFDLGSGGFDQVAIQVKVFVTPRLIQTAAFDNFQLNATAVPEPGTLTLCGVALAVGCLARRRRGKPGRGDVQL